MTIRDVLRADKNIIAEHLKNGMSCKAIARLYGCNPGTMWYFLKDNNLKSTFKISEKYGTTTECKDEIIKRYLSGESVYSISKNVGVSNTTLVKALNRWGYDTSRGSTCDRSKPLVREYEEKIITYYELGLSMNEIATNLGCANTSILTVLKKNNINRRPIAQYTINEKYFEEIDNEEKAYILGWMYSDGNVVKGKQFRIQLTEEDEYILEWIKDRLEYSGVLYYREDERKNAKPMIELSVARRKMAEDLIRHGCIPTKSLVLTFPDWLRTDLVRHFVRGYFEGDGSVSRNYVSITGSYHFIYGLKDYLPCKISNIHQRYKERDKEKSAHSLSISKREEMKKVLSWMYDNITTIVLKRKYDKMIEMDLLGVK